MAWAAAVPLKSRMLPASTFLQIDHVSVIPSAKVPFRPSVVDGTDYNDREMQIRRGRIKTRGLNVSRSQISVNIKYF